MNPPTLIGRRTVLQGALGAVAGLSDLSVRGLSFRQDDDSESTSTGDSNADDAGQTTAGNVVLTVFLRGGADFLNMVVPTGDARGAYERARPVLAVPTNETIDLGGEPFGWHPAAAPFAELFDDGSLAVVQGAGMTADTRSHFEAMSIMERGVGGTDGDRRGWLARHLASTASGDGLLPALALGSSAPESYLTANEVLALNDISRYEFPRDFFNSVGAQRTALRQMYSATDSSVHRAGLAALNGSNVIELNLGDGYEPSAGVEYPQTGFSRQLEGIAQVMKLDLGLQTATIDLGGWDTHSGQGAGSGGNFSNLVASLTEGLAAFYADLEDRADQLSVVVMSEFGRRLAENAAAGTDHGHGGMMFVLGGEVNGGVYGEWPGLDPDQLYDSADLAVTTDYRQVLSEVLLKRLGNPRLGAVFPDYDDYTPLGLVEGNDPEVDLSPLDEDEAGSSSSGAGAGSSEDGQEQAAGSNDDGSGIGGGELLAIGGVGATTAAVVVAGAAVAIRRRRQTEEPPKPPNPPEMSDL